MSDELREQAEKNRILEIVSGSHLYGTSTPTSDKDYVGVFMPPKEYVIGLKSVQEVDIGIKDKNEDGKNTQDAVDRKLYEYRKFLNLALGSNPNIIEILFVNLESIVSCTLVGSELLDSRKLFISKLCMPKFIGYAHSQKHKMIIRRDHFNELRLAYQELEKYDHKNVMVEVYNECTTQYFPDGQANGEPLFWKKDTGHHIHCGDLCFEPSVYVKKAREILKDRLDKATNRSELVLKYGFDVKFASHLIRLLMEGLWLLENGELVFPLPFADVIKDIKAGKWEIGQVVELADKLEERMEETAARSKIPKVPNYNAIEAMCMRHMDLWIRQ